MPYGYRYGFGWKPGGGYGYGYSYGPAPSPDVTNPTPEEPREPISWDMRTWIFVAIVGAVIAASGGFLFWTSSTGEGRDVTGTVRQGSSWNVRAGPSADSPIVGRVLSGDRVVVSCLTGQWARLREPRPGAYVHTNGLTLATTPPPCV
jgi:hypothetical protein